MKRILFFFLSLIAVGTLFASDITPPSSSRVLRSASAPRSRGAGRDRPPVTPLFSPRTQRRLDRKEVLESVLRSTTKKQWIYAEPPDDSARYARSKGEYRAIWQTIDGTRFFTCASGKDATEKRYSELVPERDGNYHLSSNVSMDVDQMLTEGIELMPILTERQKDIIRQTNESLEQPQGIAHVWWRDSRNAWCSELLPLCHIPRSSWYVARVGNGDQYVSVEKIDVPGKGTWYISPARCDGSLDNADEVLSEQYFFENVIHLQPVEPYADDSVLGMDSWPDLADYREYGEDGSSVDSVDFDEQFKRLISLADFQTTHAFEVRGKGIVLFIIDQRSEDAGGAHQFSLCGYDDDNKEQWFTIETPEPRNHETWQLQSLLFDDLKQRYADHRLHNVYSWQEATLPWQAWWHFGLPQPEGQEGAFKRVQRVRDLGWPRVIKQLKNKHGHGPRAITVFEPTSKTDTSIPPVSSTAQQSAPALQHTTAASTKPDSIQGGSTQRTDSREKLKTAAAGGLVTVSALSLATALYQLWQQHKARQNMHNLALSRSAAQRDAWRQASRKALRRALGMSGLALVTGAAGAAVW